MSQPVHAANDPLQWGLKPWAALTGAEVYGLMVLRQRVFVVEQRCAFQDADGYDPLAWHVWAADAAGSVVACARVFGPGVKYPQASLGRVCCHEELRRTGTGRATVGRALAAIGAIHGNVPVKISSQAYLERFYQSFGFITAGDPYLEDDIPHLAMIRPGG